jgi:uncharacterized protein
LELKDEVLIGAGREAVFLALNDPEVLKKAIPGCEVIEKISEDKFNATVISKIGPLKVRFKGEATISESNFPSDYKIIGEGRGGPAGHAKVVASVTLTEEGQSTRLTYLVQADIGGKLAQLGGALVQKTAQKISTQFFEHFNILLSTDESKETVHENVVIESNLIPSLVKALSIAAVFAVGAVIWILMG